MALQVRHCHCSYHLVCVSLQFVPLLNSTKNVLCVGNSQNVCQVGNSNHHLRHATSITTAQVNPIELI